MLISIYLSSKVGLQYLVLAGLARSVVSASKFDHATPILRSLHWLKVSERMKKIQGRVSHS
jgi:hypothetical protein